MPCIFGFIQKSLFYDFLEYNENDMRSSAQFIA